MNGHKVIFLTLLTLSLLVCMVDTQRGGGGGGGGGGGRGSRSGRTNSGSSYIMRWIDAKLGVKVDPKKMY